MPDLAAFQRDFAEALMSDGEATGHFRSPAFAVYRNTSARGVVEALRATFRTVDQLVGEEMFTQVALDFRREQPPGSAVLSDYGAGFAAFVARQPWAPELPYLADIARIDWLWLQCFLARDFELPLRSIGTSPRIARHPATRFAWLATPAMTIWQAHREAEAPADLAPLWVEEGALFTRRNGHIRAAAIDPPLHRLLADCAVPSPAADVAAAIARLFPEADLAALLRRGIASGALVIL